MEPTPPNLDAISAGCRDVPAAQDLERPERVELVDAVVDDDVDEYHRSSGGMERSRSENAATSGFE